MNWAILTSPDFLGQLHLQKSPKKQENRAHRSGAQHPSHKGSGKDLTCVWGNCWIAASRLGSFTAGRAAKVIGERRRSVAWLGEHLGDYGANPARIYVSGHSAGGHLTAMMMGFWRGQRRAGDLRPLRS
jgi:hypothetical protein